MKNMTIKYPVVSLIVLALVSGLLWRLELEYHGWKGLMWLSYTHLAIPVVYLLFLLWMNFYININWKKRALLSLLTIIYGVLIYIALGISLTYLFQGGPSGFMLLILTPEWQYYLLRHSIFVLMPIIPIGTYFILKIFKVHPPLKYLGFALIGIVASIPVSIIILEVINHQGGHNIIHSVKSGVIIPFLVFSMGLLVIGGKVKY